MMKRRKTASLGDTRKKPYTADALRKLAGEIANRAIKLEKMAALMEKEKIGSLQVDGHRGLYMRGFASFDGFIVNAQRELGLRGFFLG